MAIVQESVIDEIEMPFDLEVDEVSAKKEVKLQPKEDYNGPLLVTIPFEELSKSVGYAATLSDKAAKTAKVLLFSVYKDSTVIITSYSTSTVLNVTLEGAIVEGVKDVVQEGDKELAWRFQLSYDEITRMLNSFTNLYRTQATYVELTPDKVRVIARVHEEAIEVEDEKFSQVSRFNLTSVPISKGVEKEITSKFEGELNTVESKEVLIYLNSMMPIMSNDVNNSVVNQLNFAKDYIFALNPKMYVFFKNILPEEFQGISLKYNNMAILKKICESTDIISVGKTDKMVYVKSGNLEVFIRYAKIAYKYDKYINEVKKETGVVIDRKYFKNVLKRLAYSSKDGIFKIEEGEDGSIFIKVETKDFSQGVPCNNTKGEVVGVGFNAPIATMSKMIIGEDSSFPEELFMYFVENGNGYGLFIMDNSGKWLSGIRVRKA